MKMKEKGQAVVEGLIAMVFIAVIAVIVLLPIASSLFSSIDLSEAFDLVRGQGYWVLAQGQEIDGDLIPDGNNTRNIGSTERQWAELFVASGTIGWLQLNTSIAIPAHNEGLIFYDSVENTVAYYNDEADVTLNIGQETWLYVRNDTGSTIADGKVVYISGVVGNRPNIALAQANSTSTSSAIGVTTHSIEDGTSGYVTTYGIVHEQNTSTLNAGDIIYLSATTAGSATVTLPSFPNFVVKIAVVTVVDASEGEVLIIPDRIDYTSKVVLNSLNVLDTVSIGMNTPTSPLQVSGLPIYANNAAAIVGGLTAGAFYRDGSDPDKVCVVH